MKLPLTLSALMVLLAVFLLYFLGREFVASRSTASRKPSTAARAAEATMLFVLAFGLWLFFLRRATCPACTGYLYLSIVVVSGLPLLIAGWIAFRGAMMAAFMLLCLTLSVEGFLAETGVIHKALLRNITFDSVLPGMEIWVNEVCVGKTPLTISTAEFRRRVPLAEAPEDYAEITELNTYESPRTPSRFRCSRWCYLAPDLMASASVGVRSGRTGNRPGPGYYFRATLDGEEALIRYAGVRANPHKTFYLDARLPAQEERVVALLQQAWLRDLDVDDSWFDAALSFGRYGWRHAQSLVGEEEAWTPILEMWALRLYGLQEPRDGKEAMEYLGQLVQQVNQARSIRHRGPAPSAVRALTRHMEPEAFSRWARTHVRQGIWWIPPERRSRSISSGGWTTGSSLIGQAAWWLDQRHEQEYGESRINPLEEILVPEIIRYGHHTGGSLACAAALGGPHILRYAQRQPWRATREIGSRIFFPSPAGFENEWAFLIAMCRGPEADEFRQTKACELLFEAAHRILQTRDLAHEGKEALAFLFVDARGNRDSLAWQFWPEFRRRVLEEERDYFSSVPGLLCWYLSRMDPLDDGTTLYDARAFDPASNAEQVPYLQGYPLAYHAALRTTPPYPDCFIPRIQDLDVPRSRKREIYRALEAQCRNELGDATAHGRARIKEYLRDANQYLMELGDDSAAQAYVQNLYLSVYAHEPEGFALWLRDCLSGSPVIAHLARHSDPEFRRVTLPALEGQPSADNRALLAALCEDSDDEIRTMARTIQAKLDMIAESL